MLIEKGDNIMWLFSDTVIFYSGIALSVVSICILIISILIFKIKKIKLAVVLDDEYGK